MKVVLSGSGTAGHITPLLAVAKALYGRNPETQFLYIGHRGDPNVQLVKASQLPIEVKVVYCGKFRRYHSLSLFRQVTNVIPNLKNLRDVFLIALGMMQAAWIVRRSGASVAFLKGGSVVFPVGKACQWAKLNYVTHDSDAIPGMANALIARNATFNAVALNSAGIKYDAAKVVEVGIPLADEFLQMRGTDKAPARQKLDITEDSLMLFVFTGTQGSRIIDDALEQCMPVLLTKVPNLEVFQVFGRLNETTMNARYAQLSDEQQARIHKLSFVNNAYNYIGASDVVLGRAGATTMAEIACIGRAAVIVPAEQLTGGHQLQNAQALLERSAIKMVKESELSGLGEVLEQLLCNEQQRNELARNISHTAVTDSAERIADLLIKASGTEVVVK